MDEEGGWYGEVLDERGEMVEVRSQNEMIPGAPPQGGGDGGTRPPIFESVGDNPPIFRKIVGQIR